MTVTVLEGHVLDLLARLPAQHFHTAVTSPPYWQARRYGCPPVVWPDPEGAPPCPGGAHEWTDATVRHARHADDGSAGGLQRTSPGSVGHRGEHPGARCARCGAWRGELGQEPEVGLYVAHLVACMRAVRRVLRRDGCLWVNLAGCYFSDPGGQNGASLRAGGFRGISNKAVTANRHVGRRERTRSGGGWLKPLDWVDVPGHFARAMQADGWRWRADVTWVKGSPLPESVSGTRWERCRRKVGRAPAGQKVPAVWDTRHTDGTGLAGRYANDGTQPAWEACPGCPRCEANEGYVLRRGSGRPTKATEAVLLFVRRPGYFYDLEAERVRLGASTLGRLGQDLAGQAGSAYARATAGWSGAPGHPAGDPTAGRNLWDWWAINAEPLDEAHYAAYPTALAARCIRLATSERGCCPRCGAPWARIVARRFVPQADVRDPGRLAKAGIKGLAAECGWEAAPRGTVDSATLGWRPTCRCPDAAALAPVPCRVLDPFGGSGRTGIAADRLGRDCTLVELQPEYVAMAARLIRGDAPLLAEVAVAGGAGGAAG